MAYQVINSPNNGIYWSHTPKHVRLESLAGSWLAASSYYWVVTLAKETAYNSGTFEIVTQRQLSPGPDGKVDMDVAAVLRGFLPHQEVDFGIWEENYVIQGQRLKWQMWVQEWVDGVGGSVTTFNATMIRGTGIANINFASGGQVDLSYRFGAFLTEQPASKRVYLTQPEFLRVLLKSGTTAADLHVEITDKDGNLTLNIIPMPAVSGYEILQLGVGAEQLNLPDDTAKWRVRLTGTVSGLAGSTITDWQEYVVEDCDWSPYLRFWVWENRLGGVDTIATRGEVDVKEVVSKRSGRIMDPDDYGRLRQQISYNTSVQREMEVNSGWMLDEEFAWARGILYSNHVWLMAMDYFPQDTPQINTWMPVVIDGDTYDTHRDNEFLRSFTFTAKYSIPQPAL